MQPSWDTRVGHSHMNLSLFGFYVGPDQSIPLVSALATVFGLLLCFWNRFLGLMGRLRNLIGTPFDQAKRGAPSLKDLPPNG